MVVLESLLVKVIVGSVAALTTLRYGTGLYAWRETEKLERPSYTVLETLADGVELRRYEPYLIAETTVHNSTAKFNGAGGFRDCAGYIFGKNRPKAEKKGWFGLFSASSAGSSHGEQSGEKMAMTAPVRVSSSSSDTVGETMAMTAPVRVQGAGGAKASQPTKVSFVMGKQYSLSTAPKPINPNVQLRQVPAHTLAVRTFSGPPPKDELVERERTIIERALSRAPHLAAKLKKSSERTTLVYGYHDPFITPLLLRRNEVAVLVDGSV